MSESEPANDEVASNIRAARQAWATTVMAAAVERSARLLDDEASMDSVAKQQSLAGSAKGSSLVPPLFASRLRTYGVAIAAALSVGAGAVFLLPAASGLVLGVAMFTLRVGSSLREAPRRLQEVQSQFQLPTMAQLSWDQETSQRLGLQRDDTMQSRAEKAVATDQTARLMQTKSGARLGTTFSLAGAAMCAVALTLLPPGGLSILAVGFGAAVAGDGVGIFESFTRLRARMRTGHNPGTEEYVRRAVELDEARSVIEMAKHFDESDLSSAQLPSWVISDEAVKAASMSLGALVAAESSGAALEVSRDVEIANGLPPTGETPAGKYAGDESGSLA